MHCHTCIVNEIASYLHTCTSPLVQIMACDESVDSGLVKLRERLQVTLKKVHIRACHY